jgi:uncharacterized membrane protein
VASTADQSPEVSTSHRWVQRAWIAVAFLSVWLIMWFLMLFPLTPASYMGWAIELGSGIVVLAVGWPIASFLHWIDEQRRPNMLLKLGGYAVVPLLGVAIFVSAYLTQDQWLKSFSYFFR